MALVYQNSQIKNLEQLAVAKGKSEYDMMQQAGEAAWQVLQNRWPYIKTLTVFVGKGKNGGDGMILTRLAHQHGLQVSVFSVGSFEKLPSPSQLAMEDLIKSGIKIQKFNANIPIKAEVLVDALLGSGLKGEVTGEYALAIQTINQSNLPVLSLDIPSGVNADTGAIQGCAVKATLTLTFIGLKPGLLTGDATAYCGEVLFNPIGFTPEELQQERPYGKVLNETLLNQLSPPRMANSHKGDYGHVLVTGGDYGMGGAVRMAAEAAMRVGAGLVTVATRPEHVGVVSCSRPEIMCHEVAEPAALDVLLALSNVLVIGPGLGKSNWSSLLFKRLLESNLPKVVDADGLNLLAQMPQYSEQWILTPHPGEAARLLNTTTQEIQNDRFKAVTELQTRYGGVIVLKGAGTLIKGPDTVISICLAGNPGMASGGMGDLLSGTIGGLLAQGLSLKEAAQVGVLIHSMAADQAAQADGERGLLATDLLLHLRRLVNPK